MPTFAERMKAKYEKLLEENAGLDRVDVDGTTVSYEDLEEKHAYWARKVAREKGRRPQAAQIDLGSTYE